MKLELDIIDIKDVKFGEKTTIIDGVLYISRQELRGLLGKDKRFKEVDIDLVHPGENCRLVQVFDVTEPRCKIEGTGENFPGVLGPLRTAGEGRSRVLRGAAVVTIDYMTETNVMVIDMSGPGADRSVYAKLQNVVLLCRPVDGIAYADYQNALRFAGLKAAVYLAEAGQEIEADQTEVYNLGPLAEVSRAMEHLPRIAYIYQIHSLQFRAASNEPILYGDNVLRFLPTIVHPNEILDGALVRAYHCPGQETYSIQNHPMIKELYKRHGKDLCFLGVVITVAHFTESERERAATMAAKLVKSVLGADGAILTKIGGGAPHIDLARTCELCEELGVKTAIVTADVSIDDTSEDALIFNTPRADAIVNVGGFSRSITLPPVKRVIGGPVTFSNGEPAEAEITLVTANNLCGAVSQIGGTKEITREV